MMNEDDDDDEMLLNVHMYTPLIDTEAQTYALLMF